MGLPDRLPFIWFYSLGLGAAKIAPYVNSPKVWKVIDAVICVAMWTVAIMLLMLVSFRPKCRYP